MGSEGQVHVGELFSPLWQDESRVLVNGLFLDR